MKKFLSVIIALSMVCSLSAPAFALSATWDGDTDTLWATDGNWSAAHPVAAETATFSAAAVSPAGGVDLGAGAGCGTLLFDTLNAAAYTIGTAAAGQTLTIANGGGITVNNGVVNTETIQANVVITNGTFSNNGANDAFLLNVTGKITGTGAGTLTLNGSDTGNNLASGIIADNGGALAVTKAEAGKWILSGNNTYTGVTTVGAGTLVATNSANALGAGTLTMSGGKLQLANDTNLAFNRNTTVTASSEIDSARVLVAGAGTTHTLGTLSIGNFTLTVGLGDANTTSGTQGLTFGDVTLTGAATINAITGVGAVGTQLLTLGAVGGAAQNLTIGGTANTTIGGIIGTTTGTLTKNDAGTLSLNATNTYAGATTINAGTVKVGADGALGTVAAGTTVVAGNVAALDLNGTNYATAEALNLNGTGVGGAGALLNSAAGAATYAGAITLQSASTITSTGAGGLTLTGGITNGGFATTFDGANAATVSTTAITGAGGLTKNGAGTLTLNVANTYAGATTINAGTVKVGADGALGTVAAGTTVVAGNVAALDLNGTNYATAEALNLNGTGVGGAGALLNSAAGAATYAGAITLQSASTITSTGAGGLTLTGGITNGGFATTFDGANAATVSTTAITGAGGLTKNGAGTLTLNVANTYAGATAINAGTVVAGNANALGNGSAVTNNGTLNVGTTNVTVNAIYTQNAASNLNLTIASSSTSGKITSNANAVVSATSNVNVTVPDSIYIPTNATFTIIDGAGGAGVNVPGTITSSASRVTFTGLSSNGDLILTANRSSGGFASNATSGDSNSQAVGSILDNVTNPTGDMQTVLNTLNGLSASQTASALDTLVPEVDSGVVNTSTTALNNFVGVTMDRTESVLTLARNTADSAKTGVSAGDESKLNGVWAKGYGSYLTQDTRQGIQGYNAWNAGTALGADHLFMDCATLGVSGGYAYGNVDSDANNANTYINSAQATVYGGYEDKNLPFFVDAAGSFAWNWYNGRRDINVGNTILRTANAQYDGQQYGVYVGGGYKFDVTKNIEFTPLISLQWNHLHLQSYTETEAGALNLSVGSQDYDQLQSGVGARIASPMKYKWGTLTPEAHGKWFYDFLGQNMVVTSTFTGGGASFNGNGFRPAVNSYNAGGKLTFDFKNDISVIGDCDTQMMDEFFGIYGSVTVRYSF